MVIFTCYQSEPIYTISTLTRYELLQTKRWGGACWHRPDDRRGLNYSALSRLAAAGALLAGLHLLVVALIFLMGHGIVVLGVDLNFLSV